MVTPTKETIDYEIFKSAGEPWMAPTSLLGGIGHSHNIVPGFNAVTPADIRRAMDAIQQSTAAMARKIPNAVGRADANWTSDALTKMIASRMHWAAPLGGYFNFLEACKLPDDRVAVFLVNGAQALVIHDDWNLFPSDTLITQLRLIEGTKA